MKGTLFAGMGNEEKELVGNGGGIRTEVMESVIKSQ